MAFGSFSFFLFFILCLAASRCIRGPTAWKALLLIMSAVFYFAWHPLLFLIPVLTATASFLFGQRIAKADARQGRTGLLVVFLLLGVGTLLYYKYTNFLLSNLAPVLHALGLPGPGSRPDILMPLGVSFFTFQAIAYVADVYRGRYAPRHTYLDHLVFQTFFPCIASGPIQRAEEFLPQLAADRPNRDLAWGLALMVIGLFGKTVVADTFLAPIADQVFPAGRRPGFVQAWAGTLAYTLQIYFDFAGYSNCAIGAALCLGYRVPDNFRFPYASIGFSDFWRRWHITLSAWLRDYLYIPLGGNRHGAARTSLNLLLTMLIGGLWHGAAWLFVIWGGLHGAFLVLERRLKGTALAALPLWGRPWGRAVLAALTLACLNVTWIFFRAPGLDTALGLAGSLFRPLGAGSDPAVALFRPQYLTVAAIAAGTFGLHLLWRGTTLREAFERLHWTARSAALGFMLYCVALSLIGEDNAFIYFQF